MVLLLNDVDPWLVLVHGIQNDLQGRMTEHCPERKVDRALKGYKTMGVVGWGDLINIAGEASEI